MNSSSTLSKNAKHGAAIRVKTWVTLCACLIGLAPVLQAQLTQPVVAVHDSELTRALESLPATGATPTGSGTSGFQWWLTDWHYFVMPESVKEALRSDGTPFTVIGDSNINSGLLLPSGAPKYPIVISLAAEAIQDSEIAQLTNYVAAGGFLVVGSSAFTRNPDGSTRGDFAFANELGAHMVVSGLVDWAADSTFTKAVNHRLVSHIPDGPLQWQMPSGADEIPWGTSPSHPFLGTHDLWRVTAGDATVIANGDASPYVLVKPFGKGWFIYVAALQPLVGHGGFAPGMYSYVIFRQAIEWAFASANLPVAKVSPWPYQYDAAFILRHDLEDYPSEIAHIGASAQVENSLGAKGDYYFCTGTLRGGLEGLFDTNAAIAGMQQAVTLYGASVGPHNGGLANPRNPALVETNYDYWHWGPDEALDVIPAGYPDGKTYAMDSIAASFADVEGWLPGLATTNMRAWVAPYFNATREDSLDIQSQLGVKIAGDEKLTPFPHWTLSTRTSGKRYPMLSEPVSDWFVGGLVAQSLEPWHPPGVQTSATLHAAVDYYYALGGLLNFYSHTLATGEGPAGSLMPDYMTYCLNTNLHPRMWAANAVGVYNWWSNRAAVQTVVSCTTNGSQTVVTVGISGATDPQTTVELLLPAAGRIATLQVLFNGAAAPAGSYRTNGRVIKLLVGTSVTGAQVTYLLAPVAVDDFYQVMLGSTLTVAAPGILGNDQPGTGNGGLTASRTSGPAHGLLSLNASGAFTYTPTNGYLGADSFTYVAGNGQTNSAPATVNLTVNPPGVMFSDQFTRTPPPGQIAPWTQQDGAWTITNGALVGVSGANSYGNAYFNDSTWTDYTVQARFQFSATNAFGGGLGGRLNPVTGQHYGAWIYPEGSTGGSAVLKLIKFTGWTSWSGTPMQTVGLPGVGTNGHTLAFAFKGAGITISYDGVQIMSAVDTNYESTPPYATGGISADLYTDTTPYTLAVQNVQVTSAVPPPIIATQPVGRTNLAGTTASFNVVATGLLLSYQWNFNGTNLAGATNSAYAITNAQPVNTGTYTVVVTNLGGSVTSVPVTLNVYVPPAIVTQPASRTNVAGTSASFSVVAAGTPLNYQWRLNGAILAGATSSVYSIASAQSANAGNYTVTVTNWGGSVTSTAATLTVNSPPAILSQPVNLNLPAGYTVAYSVTATGTAPLAFQWQFNGANIAGATTSTYAMANIQNGNAGNYAVVVSNRFGSVASQSAKLKIKVDGSSPAQVPIVLEMLSPQLSGAGFCFGFQTAAGQSYTIEQTTNLTATNWAVYTNFIGNGSSNLMMVPVHPGKQWYFRVREP